jgi:hypothetical protein
VKRLVAKPRSPALAAFVKSFHYHETNFPFTLERIMPNGQAHFMVNLAEDEFRTYDPARPERTNRHSGAVLAGPHGMLLAYFLFRPEARTYFRYRETMGV